MNINQIRESQEEIYRELYNKYKGTPKAVSTKSKIHKKLRFDIISRLFEEDESFSLHDVGMGVADFYQYLLDNHKEKNIEYTGSEILSEFCQEARSKFSDLQFYNRNLAAQSYEDHHDYLIMSGVFHQRRSTPIKEWEDFAQKLIYNSFQMCKKGVAFNFVSPFVDFYQEGLYYCNLPKFLNFINDELSRFFRINHDYALYEITIFVYKEAYIKQKFPQSEFNKYFKS